MADDRTALLVELDDASKAALIKGIGDAIAKGGAAGTKKMQAEFAKLFANTGRQANQMGRTIGAEALKGFRISFRGMDAALKSSSAAMKRSFSADAAALGAVVQVQQRSLMEFQKKVNSQKVMDWAASTPDRRRVLQTLSETNRTSLTQPTAKYIAELKALGRKEAETIRANGKLRAVAELNAGKLQAIEQRKQADIMTRQARQSGEMRVAITKTALKSITIAERATVAAVTGLAKTTTSALSRMASSIGSVFRRSNHDVTDGLSQSLNKRESLMRNSFSQQESIVRRSILRQEAQMGALRTQTSRGVLGAVSGRGVGMGLGALVGGVGIAAWLKGGYTEAINLNEQLNKTRVVFGAMSDEVIKFASNSVNSLGATKAEALQALSTFGNLFRSMNIGEAQSAAMSERLTQLASDLSSFNNVPIEDVFTALRSGLVGEQEPLRKLGVNLNEATLKLKAMELGLFNGKGTLSANAKAQAAYALILEQTTLAQGDFARTMNEGANAQRRAGKAAKELAASIMVGLMPAVTVGMNAVTKSFTGLAAAINDQTNPALHLLKRALLGAAAGMGAVIAMKGAIEVIKLLGTATKLALGPMGLILLAFGGIGAALAVLMDRSDALRQTMGILGERFAAIGAKIKTAFAPLLQRAGDFIDDTLIPAIDRLAQWLADHLVGAFDAAVRGLRRFVEFMRAEVFPIVGQVATGIGVGFRIAKDAVVAFAQTVRPLIQPAIDGFKALGGALRAALGGDFSGLGSGLGAAGSGILSSLGNIAGRVAAALAPAARAVWGWVKDTFSVENLKRYAIGFLDFIEWLGYQIGHIVSHPTFIKAVAGIAAAAVIIGGKFALGFAKGVIDNLPKVWSLLTDALRLGFIALFKAIAGNIGTAFLVALGVYIVGPALFSMFRKGGDTAGVGFFTGLKSKITTHVKDFVTSFQNNLAVMQLWGGAIVDAGRRFSVLRQSGESAFTSLRQSFTRLWADMKLAAEVGGTTVGKVLGSAIRGAATVALAGFGGFMAGKAEGQSGGSGLMSALMVGLGVGAINPIAGVVAAGAALIGAAMGRSSKAAQEAKQKMEALGAGIRDVLVPAMKAGESAADGLARALAGDDKGSLEKSLLAFLSPKTKELLRGMGVGLADIERAMTGGAGAREALLKRFESGGILEGTASGATRAWLELSSVFREVDKQIRLTNTDAALMQRNMGPGAHIGGIVKANTVVKESIDAVTQAHINMQAELLKELPVPGVSDFQAAFDSAVLAFEGLGPRIAEALSMGGLVGEATRNQLKTQLANNINTAITQGIADGTIKTKEELAARLRMLIEQAGVGGGDGAAKWLAGFGDELLPGLIELFGKSPQAAAEKWLIDNGLLYNIGVTAGGQLTDGIALGIALGVHDVALAARQLAEFTKIAAELGFDIHSPSKVFQRIGRQLGEGLAIGIREGITPAIRAAGAMSDAVTAKMSTQSLADLVAQASQASGGSSTTVNNSTRNQTIDNHLYLPSGDPSANALAVANRQALAW